jgi:MraZ protein
VEKWKKVWKTAGVVFKGTYRYRIDPKGRLPVPAPFRRSLGADGGGVVVTRLDDCLAVYPRPEWTKLESQLLGLPAFSAPVKALVRVLASQANDCALDVQGRILLPGPVRAAVGLGAEAVVVGVLNRFEVWAPEAWEAFLRGSERLLEDVSLDVPWPLPPASPAAGPDPGRPSTRKP